MSTRLDPAAHNSRSTDHSDEITRMRNHAQNIRASYPDYKAAPRVHYLEVRVLECAADLLEVHDATGISLDNWDAARKLVLDGLLIIGASVEDFLENGV